MGKETELPEVPLSDQIQQLGNTVDNLLHADNAILVDFFPGQEPFPVVTAVYLKNDRYNTLLKLEEHSKTDGVIQPETYLTFRIVDKLDKRVDTIKIVHGITPLLEGHSYYLVDYTVDTDVPSQKIVHLTTNGASFKSGTYGVISYFDASSMIPMLQDILNTSEIDATLQNKTREYLRTVQTVSSVK